MAEELAEMVSRDAISLSKDFDALLKNVVEYHDLMDNCIRNFYEIVWLSPLFELCNTLHEGRKNFDMEDAEFDDWIAQLVAKVNAKFGTSMVARGGKVEWAFNVYEQKKDGRPSGVREAFDVFN